MKINGAIAVFVFGCLFIIAAIVVANLPYCI